MRTWSNKTGVSWFPQWLAWGDAMSCCICRYVFLWPLIRVSPIKYRATCVCWYQLISDSKVDGKRSKPTLGVSPPRWIWPATSNHLDGKKAMVNSRATAKWPKDSKGCQRMPKASNFLGLPICTAQKCLTWPGNSLWLFFFFIWEI